MASSRKARSTQRESGVASHHGHELSTDDAGASAISASDGLLDEQLASARVALPLLAGLSRRPEVREKAAFDALRRYQAARIIAAWAKSHWTKRRKDTSERVNVARLIGQNTCRANDQSHWIFRALQSPSLRVRRAAIRIMVDSVVTPLRHHDHSTALGSKRLRGKASSPFAPRWRHHLNNDHFVALTVLCDVLVNVIQQELDLQLASSCDSTTSQQNPHHSSSSTLGLTSFFSTPSSSMFDGASAATQPEGGDPVLQLVAVLSLIVCDLQPCSHEAGPPCSILKPPGSKSAVGATSSTATSLDAARNEVGSVVGTKLPKGSLSGTSPSRAPAVDIPYLCSTELFVAAGGLRWATGNILRLLSSLVRRDRDSAVGGIPSSTLSRQSSLSDSPSPFTKLSSESVGLSRTTPSSWIPQPSADTRLPSSFGATSGELSDELCQARIAVLVDLCLRSVMFASIHLPQPLPDQHADTRESVGSDGKSLASSCRKGGTKRHRGGETQLNGTVPAVPTPSSSTRTTSLSFSSFAGSVRKMRQETLERVHDVLWTSRIPAAYVGGVDGAPLSPLACLICANEVLRCTSGQPLPPKIRGMDRCMLALNRLVDPSGSVVVVTPTAPPSVSSERISPTATSTAASSVAKATSSRSRRKRGVSMMASFSGGSSSSNSPPTKRGRSRRRREESGTRIDDAVRRVIGATSAVRTTTLEGSDVLRHLRERGSVSSLLERIAEEEGRSDGHRGTTTATAATVAAIDRVQEIMAPSMSALEAEEARQECAHGDDDEDDNDGDEAMDTNVEEMVEVVDLEELGRGDEAGEDVDEEDEEEDEDEEDEEIEDEEEEDEEEDGDEREGGDEDAEGDEGEGEMEERSGEEYEEVGNEGLIVEENEDGVTVRVADEDEEDEADGDDGRIREDSLDTEGQEEVEDIVRAQNDDAGAQRGGAQVSDVVMVEMEQDGEDTEISETQPNVAAAEQGEGSIGSTALNTSQQFTTIQPTEVAAPSASSNPTNTSSSALSSRTSSTSPTRSGGLTVDDRRRSYLVASMEVMEAHHFQVRRHGRREMNTARQPCGGLATPKAVVSGPLLTAAAEHSLLQSICDIVKPPRKPPNLKIFLRRAPTQEEFFRGTLSRNPISLSTLRSRTRRPNAANTTDDGNDMAGDHEPTVRDLRQYIADNLQMSDSAEMLELLVSNKILDVNLKLRVVSQVLVRQHTMEGSSGSTSGSSFLASFVGGSGAHLIASGSGLMVFGTNAGSSRSSGRRGAPSMSLGSSVLLPLVVTYRLTGVDGEATEERVGETDLVDPEARPDTESSSRAYEERMEKEFGLTRSITDGNGIYVLLRSVRSHIQDILRRIRRDEVAARESRRVSRTYASLARKNATRTKLLSSAVHPSLMLLRHCAQIADNRRQMVKARSPTLLLRMLLDVLNAIDDSPTKEGVARDGDTSLEKPSQREGSSAIARNPTAAILQELIEVLSSDIADEAGKDSERAKDLHIVDPAEGESKSVSHDDDEMDGEVGATLSLLLSSLRTTSLSPPFRKIISKLLPFLTYGRGDLSNELAVNFVQSISEDVLCAGPGSATGSGGNDLLSQTLLDSALCLPSVSVCDGLRMELLEKGFVRRLKEFIMRQIPRQPPPWSPALLPKVAKGSVTSEAEKARTTALRDQWDAYFNRKGLKTGIEVLTSLATQHAPTQSFLGDAASDSGASKRDQVDEDPLPSLIQAFHWIESTSDNVGSGISTNGLGILAETLLDTISEDNASVSEKIRAVRKQTRSRKREIAEERRSKALVGMSSFGPLAGVSSMEAKDVPTSSTNAATSLFSLTSFAAALASTSQTMAAAVSAVTGPSCPVKLDAEKASATKPSWMEEMEAMEDEKGLTCAVCQEGRTLKPSEMLGLYAYVKKVSIPYNRCGGKGHIDGTMAFISLPKTLPSSLVGGEVDIRLFQPALATADEMRSTPHAIAVTASASATGCNSSRPTHFVTTVTAGNAIHCSCHSTARSADRHHPKAPKGEWEGASLRNSRVTCNAILPLVSTKCSTVPLVAVETALTDYQTTIANVLGSRPKSMLWTVLHDVRFLLLRMAYGEPLNADCGGGSLSSNSMLLFYQLFMADMFAKDAELDTPDTARHAKNLPACFLAAVEILGAKDFEQGKEYDALRVSVADAAPMAAICCLLFDSALERTKCDDSSTNRQPLWPQYREQFYRGLLRCAGRRKACGIIASGCVSSRGSNTAARLLRSESLADFLVEAGIESDTQDKSSSKRARIDDDDNAALVSSTLEGASQFLRPMLTLFIVMNKLHYVLFSSSLSSIKMDDEAVENGSQQVVDCLEACRKCATVEELVDVADKVVKLEKVSILNEYEKGRQMTYTASVAGTTS